MGSGIYVRETQGARRVTAEAPLEPIRARQLVESELAAHAARTMKRSQVTGLRESIAMMENEAETGQTPARGDRLFHLRIAEASDNSVLVRIVSELYDERHNPLFEQLGSHFETARSWATAIAEHRSVVDAIAGRSPPAARDAMAQHLGNSHDRFIASWPGDAAEPAAEKRRATR